ncbi:YcaO-like family protein [Streptomyces sp. NPDC007369]|uniref:YcaO-like family protein n=1 Tax=Streptomyces sp. NPDC007369 TaxID=3154589 RepID=UPI0033DEE646
MQIHRPFAGADGIVLGRVAAASRVFAVNDAAGGRRVLIGSAIGTDPADVERRARGELMERMHNLLSGHRPAPGAVVASYGALRRLGRPALDPAAWHELRSVPRVRDMLLAWVQGRSLTGAGEVLVPACAVYLAHRPPPDGGAPLRPGSTGLAAHPDRASALRHAVLEILERDLLHQAWYAGAPRLAPSGPAPLAEPLRQALTVLGVRERCLVLPGPAGTSCVVACLHTPDGARQSFGCRATAGDLARAADAAVQEALMVRWSMGTTSARSVWNRMRGEPPSRPPSGPLEHALHAFHRQNSLAHLLSGALGARWGDWPAPGSPAPTGRAPHPAPAPATAPAPAPALALAPALADRTGEDVVEVDTTCTGAEVAGAGAGAGGTVVVRVVAPGARRLPAEEPVPPDGCRHPPPHPLG